MDADVSSPYTNAQPLTGDDDASQSVPDFSMTDVSTPYILESLEQVYVLFFFFFWSCCARVAFAAGLRHTPRRPRPDFFVLTLACTLAR